MNAQTTLTTKVIPALVAILEDATEQGGEDYSLAGLIEHHAALFEAPDLEHYASLYEVGSLIASVRAGDIKRAAAIKQLQQGAN